MIYKFNVVKKRRDLITERPDMSWAIEVMTCLEWACTANALWSCMCKGRKDQEASVTCRCHKEMRSRCISALLARRALILCLSCTIILQVCLKDSFIFHIMSNLSNENRAWSSIYCSRAMRELSSYYKAPNWQILYQDASSLWNLRWFKWCLSRLRMDA